MKMGARIQEAASRTGLHPAVETMSRDAITALQIERLRSTAGQTTTRV